MVNKKQEEKNVVTQEVTVELPKISIQNIKFLIGAHVMHVLSKKEGFVTHIHIEQSGITYTVGFDDKTSTTHFDFELHKKS